ncbi:MAG: GNAT family N-acetyltransferase [Novosphingobium sp.]|uniref:GNAT family N-acetyltransferase n=1 Tax=Novosphingobium sp. TaxID=1874826 RepID=UPI0017DAD3C2|nr:GNAT family N-acetyltransferase [Novosphingobium sp.]
MGGAALTIRPLAKSDYGQWLEVWDGYNAFYGRSGPTALDPAITACTWQRLFDPYEPIRCLVADAGGSLGGVVHYLLHRNTTAIEPSIYLQDLYTRPDLRGTGIGRALIQAVYNQAALQGCGLVYWHTQESNFVAQQLYDHLAEKSGFIVYRKLINQDVDMIS